MDKREALEHRLTIMIGPTLKHAIEDAAARDGVSVGLFMRAAALSAIEMHHPARAEVIEAGGGD